MYVKASLLLSDMISRVDGLVEGRERGLSGLLMGDCVFNSCLMSKTEMLDFRFGSESSIVSDCRGERGGVEASICIVSK